MRKLRLTVFLVLLFVIQIYGQILNHNNGIPHIQNYSPQVYKQHEQNWTTIQDQHGIMYFGNTHGLLQYDGTTWNLIKTVSPDVVRSLALSDKNEIYVGGYNYFGRISSDSRGKLTFINISDSLKDKHRIFNNVWRIHATDHGVYFQTDSALFKWHQNRFRIWKTTYPMNRSFFIHDTLYLQNKNNGLMFLHDNMVQKVQGGEIFADEKIYAMTSLERNKILIGTRNRGLFILTQNSVIPFKTEIDDYIKKELFTDMVLLQDGNIAVSTIKNGFAVINQKGEMIYILNKESGLADNTVWNLYTDTQYGIWLALNNGISRIELPAPVSYFDEKTGIEGTVESIVRHKGKLYIATTLGLYSNDPSNNTIEKIPNFRPYFLISNGTSLLASGYTSGTYELQSNLMVRISDYSGYTLHPSLFDSNRIFIGLDDGIAAIYYKNGRWTDEGFLKLNTSPVREIVESPEGNLWLGTSDLQVIMISFPDKKFAISKAHATYFDQKSGLNNARQNYIFSFEDKILSGSGNQLLEFDPDKNQFKPCRSLNSLFHDSSISVYKMIPDQRNNYWVCYNSDNGYGLGVFERQSSGEFRWQISDYLPLAGLFFYTLQTDPSANIVWLGGAEGMIRFDRNFKKNYQIDYKCLVRNITTMHDSVLLNRNMDVSQPSLKIKHSNPISYNSNALRFEFSAPFFEHENMNQYQYYLDGFDKRWSAWTSDTKATYTNIPEGKYRFRVKAKNLYGHISEEGVFSFEILPPWYRTSWAYGIYFILLIGFISGLIKWRSYQLEIEKKRLEGIIDQRTAELKSKNMQLAEQAEKLKELDHLKSRFFTNISHEFRTPLTLIIGPVEEMLKKVSGSEPQRIFKVILRNARRLLRLINQLLDLSKLESGSMVLKASLQPLSPFLKTTVYSFSSFAESKKIQLDFIDVSDNPELWFERDKLEKIIYNLISNALKFTPENGHVTVTLQDLNINNDRYPDGAVEISVQDSGIGISKEQQSLIFDRFTQINHKDKNKYQGSGIGLALVKELVTLHHGEIKVKSEPDQGSQFDIILPKGRQHLDDSEITEKTGKQEDSQDLIELEISETNNNLSNIRIPAKSVDTSKETIVLVVEDNQDVRSYICDYLKKQYGILCAENGKTGFDLAMEHVPDLIVSDVMMPEMDGYELCHRIKSESLTSHIPVILLTAKASDKEKIEGLETGADAYLTKPFNADELKVRVRKLIEGRQKLRQKFKKEVLLEPSEIDTESFEDQLLQKAHDLIEKNMSDHGFNAETLQKEMAMSRRQFYRKILALTDQTPGQFIRTMRLKRAMQLIRHKSGSVTQIAFDVGFSNLSYFAKCFKEQFGKLPSDV